MGIRILYDSDTWDAATITSSSETGDLADDNVVDDRVAKPWRTTGVSSEWIKFDLGSAVSLTCLGMFGFNLTSSATVTLQANSIDDWTTPPFDQTLTLVTDTDGNVLERLVHFPSTSAYQYWRVTFADASNSDGYIEVGRIKAGSYYEPSRNFREDFSVAFVDPSQGEEQPGIVGTWRERTIFRQASVSFEFMSETQFREFETLYRKVGKRKPIIVALDPINRPSKMSMYCTLKDTLPLRHILVEQYGTGTIVFEEKVE